MATHSDISAPGPNRTFLAISGECTLLFLILSLFLSAALRSSAQAPFIPGRLLIKPRLGVSETNFVLKLKNRGATHHRSLSHVPVRVVTFPEDKMDSVIASLRQDSDIQFVERDYVAKAAFVPDDPYVLAGTEWHLQQIQAPSAWNVTSGQGTVLVAVLDSGINAAHPDLAGQIDPGYDFVNNNNDPIDDFGHGTAVSGVIVAAGNNGVGVAGVAYGVRLLPVKVMDASGFASYSCIAQGIQYAVDQGARIINISIAGDAPSAALQEAINYAWSNNVVVVAAAGNNANNLPQYPAACDHVVAVAATEPDDSRSWFSSYGSDVALGAPGDNIWTTQRDLSNPYGAWRGTSFASPIVAGVAALMASENNSLPNTQIVSLLEQTADPPAGTNDSTSLGFGRVNASRAVTAASLQSGAAPVITNLAPTILLSSPADSAEFTIGATVPVTANAWAGGLNGQITNLTLFANGEAIGSSRTAPFIWDWTPAGAGTYTLTLTAFDDQGLSATSAPVSIAIVPRDPDSPILKITAGPANHSRLTSSRISIAGTATAQIGIRQVQVQLNGGEARIASGTDEWNADIDLEPGRNVVLVRGIDALGNASPSISRSFTYVVEIPLAVRINGEGRISPSIDGKMLELGKSYTIRAVPDSGQAFAGWTGLSLSAPVLSFVMSSNLVLEANFVPSPFPALKGNYAGLMADTNGVLPENSGYFKLSVANSGRFTGKLLVGGKGYGFHGSFDLSGNSLTVVRRGKSNPLSLSLQLDMANAFGHIGGGASDGGWDSEISADRNIYNAATNPPSQAGARDFVLRQARQPAQTAAMGISFISNTGRARVKGKLDDGRTFCAGSLLGKNGDCPFYLSLSHGGEVVIGWLNFPATPTPAATGTVLWVRTGTNAFAATLQAASP